jgi:predicted RNA-binding Zn-ribbon protein involved in translation (DUF1610 family)
VTIAPLARTLDQELSTITRGASLECPVCGEFLWRTSRTFACLECRSILAEGREVPALAIPSIAQAG